MLQIVYLVNIQLKVYHRQILDQRYRVCTAVTGFAWGGGIQLNPRAAESFMEEKDGWSCFATKVTFLEFLCLF